jgi:GT2 family glycosyltransferase
VSEPAVSVVIVSARRTRLAFALEALAAQTLPEAEFEVIVVRDAPEGAPPDVPGVAATWLDGEGSGNIAALRNQGWRAARAPYLAFTDDDCRPVPDWLERLLERSGPGRIVQGRTRPDPDEAHLLHGLARSQTVEPPSGWYETCNILYPRDLLEREGGFDEHFGALGEDADLGLRATEAGAEVVAAADAQVMHGVLPRTLPAAMRAALRRDTMPLVIARHPNQRTQLPLGYFWKESHWRLLLALGGLALARPGRRWPLLAAVPYVRYHFDPQTRTARSAARQAAGIGSRALVDGAEVVATARGSVRERVPLL